MKINSNTVIVGEKIILVPYKKLHVEKYYRWMGDESILEQTASERLTLEEEYENQQSWYEDEHKITFIILDKDLLPNREWKSNLDDEKSMVGDVNIFFNEYEEEGTGELEIMIAEKNSRRKGIAREAINLIMHYAMEKLCPKTFIVKIGEENQSSIELFKKLNFTQNGPANVFKEINMTCPINDQLVQSYKSMHQNLRYLNWE
ncbi:hypothetical protein CYY_008236 [Polysphondylium violaceum]|uniref:N-acetyltransferase 9-like protein n=1 Tax=Polysphondylium violaceum TaxID=133409 RepID=A0A8J4UQB0_9MYCE|nr:hypothetical protein CYY_008236 [Polysphondylium violaceum]